MGGSELVEPGSGCAFVSLVLGDFTGTAGFGPISAQVSHAPFALI